MSASQNDRVALLAGGSGLIGSALQRALPATGLRTRLLSRQRQEKPASDRFYWDPERGFLNPDALNHVEAIINLAGASVAGGKWSARRKQEIITSRVQSHELILQKLEQSREFPRTLVAASAIGYYGNRGDELLTEASSAGVGFLPETAIQWERAAMRFEALGVRTVILRIGVVLAANGGALPRIAQPIRMMLGAPLGSGLQYMSWVHIDDVVAMILRALTDESWRGVYNCVAPAPVNNAEFTRAVAAKLSKPLFLPHVPEAALRLAMGEMASIVLDSTRVAPERALGAGFEFQYSQLDGALQNLLGSSGG